MSIGIYKITSPSNNVYIGQSVNIELRISKYKSISIVQKQPKIFRSIQKYGWENHTWEILEICEISQLDERETFHKKKIIEELGWARALFCKLHDCIKDKPLPESVKNKIGKSNLGKRRTDEVKNKMSMIRTRGNHCKPTYQYDLEGNYLKMWEYREDAEIFYNGKKGNNITSCIRNSSLSAYGFIWKSEYLGEKIEVYKPNYNPIQQIDTNHQLIKIWDNMSQAEQFFNPDSFKKNKYGSNNIRSCIKGRQSTAYGFIWKYL